MADPVGALFDMFSSTGRFFQFFAKIVIFAAASKPGHISEFALSLIVTAVVFDNLLMHPAKFTVPKLGRSDKFV